MTTGKGTSNSDEFEQHSLHSEVSISWIVMAERLNYGAHFMYVCSSEAEKRIMERDTKEFNESKHEFGVTKIKFLSEEENTDSLLWQQISTAYFLLTRAIENILKAILIEKSPKHYYDYEKNKTDFKIKNGHDLLRLVELSEIKMTEEQLNLMALLNFEWQTYIYPTTMLAQQVVEINAIRAKVKMNISNRNYPKFAELFDFLCTCYNGMKK